mgnify:CR=1 FL=1
MRVSYTWALAAALMAIGHVMGLQCSADRKLKKYNLEKVIHVKAERNTPPSTTTQDWYINICDADREGMPAECNDDDMVCGLQWVKLPDEDPILTQVIHVDSNKYKETRVYNGHLGLEFKGFEYADDIVQLGVNFQCDLESEEDVSEFSYLNWAYLYVAITGPSGCVKKEYDHGHANDPNFYYRERGLRWYWWLPIYMGLFTLIYCVVVSYLNTRGGSFQDFRDDFIDRIRTFIVTLASIVKDIVSTLSLIHISEPTRH